MAEQTPDLPQTISFENKFFCALSDIIFFRDERTGVAMMRLPLDNATAELPLAGIRNELKLESDSHDDRMLGIIDQALDFVQGLRIGDPIPTELSSGQASWEVTQKHQTKARARLSLQLVSWMSGDEEVIHDATQLDMIAEDPATRAKVNEAFKEAAVKLGMEENQSGQVIDLVNGLGEELSYIEALRDQFEYISVVEKRIYDMAQIYRTDQGMMETITQVTKLCAVPMRDFRHKFDELDAQTGEIIAVLKNMASQVKFIRESRDDLHRRFWAWKPLADKWHDQPAKRSRFSEDLVAETYRFLAQRFLPQKEWELFSKAQDEAAKKATESVW